MKILLTGSSSGIGQDLTKRLLLEGHSVWGWARSAQIALPGEFVSSRVDVAEWESVKDAAEELRSKWGAVDALICATGIQGAMGPAMSLDVAEWKATVDSNLHGTFHTLKALYPLLKSPGGRAKVVCFSGGGATGSRPNFSAYAVAKTGIVRLVEVLAEEWKLAGAAIDINSLSPGAIYTRMTDETIAMGPKVVGEKEYASALKTRETGGGSLEKVYGLVRYLLSPQSDTVSGRLVAAQWDPWDEEKFNDRLAGSEAYTLRRTLLSENQK